MIKIHGFVLKMNPTDEKRFLQSTSSFLKRKSNLRSHFAPHITLFLCPLPKDKMGEMADLLRAKISFEPIVVSFGQAYAEGDRYISLPFDNGEVVKLHDNLLELIKPITKGNYNKKYLDYGLSKREKEYLEEYGYHRIKEFFKPHLTIGKYKDTKTRDEELECAPLVNGKYTFDIFEFDETDYVGNEHVANRILWNRGR